MLAGKRILLGITGGIAAYKIPEFIRLLKAEGAEVKVVCTPQSLDFVTPLTLATTSGNPVVVSLFDAHSGTWVNHVELALWADVMVIAPLTANSLAGLVNGKTDNAVLVTALCTRCPVVLVPAMDHDMWEHQSTLNNIQKAETMGYALMRPEYGALASGLIGQGRMPEPSAMLQFLTLFQQCHSWWKGKKVLISSGGTREAIDPVRFISNQSSGKMGVALAEAAYCAGAQVTLVRTRASKMPHFKNINCIEVETALQMQSAISGMANEQDVICMAAAVADFRVDQPSLQKLKKKDQGLDHLIWVENPDILKGLALENRPYFLLGFALESNGNVQDARLKLLQKGADALALNSLTDTGAGFGTETNKMTLITHDSTYELSLKPKTEIAVEILNIVAECKLKSSQV